MSGVETFAGLLLAFLLQMRSESRSPSSPFRYQKQSEVGFLLPASSGTRQKALPHPIANSFWSLSLICNSFLVLLSLSLRDLDLDHDRATLGWDDTLSRSQSTLSAIMQINGTTNNLVRSFFYSLFFLFINALQFLLHFFSFYTSPTRPSWLSHVLVCIL